MVTFVLDPSWDDEDGANSNSVSGVLPDGEFGGNTRCCRSNGERSFSQPPIPLCSTSITVVSTRR